MSQSSVKSAAAVPLSLFPPVKPKERAPGWISGGDRVVILTVKDAEVTVQTGHVTSYARPRKEGDPDEGERLFRGKKTPAIGCSHFGADNVTRTVVWGDSPFNQHADSADDAFEESFDVADPNLLKVSDAEFLKDSRRAIEFFEGVYPPQVAEKIAERLSASDFYPAPDPLLVALAG